MAQLYSNRDKIIIQFMIIVLTLLQDISWNIPQTTQTYRTQASKLRDSLQQIEKEYHNG